MQRPPRFPSNSPGKYTAVHISAYSVLGLIIVTLILLLGASSSTAKNPVQAKEMNGARSSVRQYVKECGRHVEDIAREGKVELRTVVLFHLCVEDEILYRAVVEGPLPKQMCLDFLKTGDRVEITYCDMKDFRQVESIRRIAPGD